MIFQFVNKQGKMETIEARDAQEALRLSAPKADPHSGVAVVDLPSSPQTPTLPDQPKSNLLSFQDILSKATDLAREKRNALSLSFMGSAAPFGTMMASDFNSILSNMNRASEQFTSDVLKRQIKENTFKQMFVGDDLMEFEIAPSGKVVGQGKKITSKPDKPEPKEIARKKFGVVSSKIINELNDEQLQEFIIDFDAAEAKDEVSYDALLFLDAWKKEVGIEEDTGSFKKKLKDAVLSMKESGTTKEKAEKQLKKEYGDILPEAVLEVLDEVFK